MDEAAKITKESSRYNIGTIVRTINVPTFPLMLLRPVFRQRFEFTERPRQEAVNGQAATRIDFLERTRPTITRSAHGDNAPLDGSFWLDVGSGRVLKSLVKTVGTPDPGKTGFFSFGGSGVTELWVQVSYAMNDVLGVSVPTEMTEFGATPSGSRVDGKATYSNFLRFQVNTSETAKSVKTP
jgi:hypothetical protein